MHGIYEWVQLGFTLLFGALAAIGGWIMKRMHARMDYLERSHTKHRLHVAEQYVNKTEMSALQQEMRAGFTKIEAGMERIYDKLDGKADK